MNQSGSILIFTMLLLGIMLAIVLTLTGIFLPKILLSSQAKGSVGALYAADSGMEWCLYVNQVGNINPPVMANTAEIKDNSETALDTSDCASSPIRIIGTHQGVSRALEVSF